MEEISFHVYEYKVSVRKDGKEPRRLELVQKRAKIGEFHRLYYGPVLGRGCYHSTSYHLAARCWKERRVIKRGSVSTHRNKGERMPLSFNEEIQISYYQNTSVSVEGTLLEWVDKAGETLTRFFGHWSDDSKQDAAATTWNMRCKLCVDGDPTQLVEGLDIGGTALKGTDGAGPSYRCGKSIYGQSLLSAELNITIDFHVEAPGTASGGSTERRGPTSASASGACAASIVPRWRTAARTCSPPSGSSVTGRPPR